MMTTTNTGKATAKKMGVCPRCIGGGQTRFRHIADGVCFGCNGTGKVEIREARPMKVTRSASNVAEAEHQLRALYGAAKYWTTEENEAGWWKPAYDGYETGSQIAYYLQVVAPDFAARARAAFVALLGAEFAEDLAALEAKYRN